MRQLLFVGTLLCSLCSVAAKQSDLDRWKSQAKRVTITRDDWGIAHVHGKSDADTVFGALYAQAEDDFNRIEMNYLNALGRLSELEGENQIWRDLRMRIFIEPQLLKIEYQKSPRWLRQLATAFADGLNFYLYKHPHVQPKVIQKFEPWMVFAFTEGSIGGDIERIDLSELSKFYGDNPKLVLEKNPSTLDGDMRGSNGIAIAPSKSSTKNTLLLINPHTSFYFRSELQMTSNEGLNAYGASTWGQFFIYQGFNERAGWMHTSSTADVVDEFLETVSKKGEHFVYEYAGKKRQVTERIIHIPFRTAKGNSTKTFKVYYTHHGPIIRAEGEKWVAVRLMQRPTKALIQSFLRTKARGLKAYQRTMEFYANSSNNTVFADADGNIAFFFGNFLPKRDASFDWSKPVDGTNRATDWKGIWPVEESPHLINPNSGWISNTNNWPWTAAGPGSLKQSNFAPYLDAGTENPRGVHAMTLLRTIPKLDIDSLITLAYDSYLPWFEKPLGALFQAWDALSNENPQKKALHDQIEALRKWNRRWALDSVSTSLAVYWGENVVEKLRKLGIKTKLPIEELVVDHIAPSQLLESLAEASQKISNDFGDWRTPWGEINRLQRISGEIEQSFSDDKPSIPVPFTAGLWGSLASFGAKSFEGNKKRYGIAGNSFVAVVEFGKRVRAKAITVGGASGNPSSKHFNDQAERYANGHLREVYFYPDQLAQHTLRSYRPGQS